MKKGKKLVHKEGMGRLFELAGRKKAKLFVACFLSVISMGMRIAFFFAIYGVIREVLISYREPQQIDMQQIWFYGGITMAGVVLYGLCAFASSAIAHVSAYDLLYEIRLQLMEKMSHISSGYFTGVTQGAIKKIMSDDVESLETFVAHDLCEIAAAVAAPLFTLIFLFTMDWKLALVTLLPIIISIFLLGSCLKKKDKAQLQKEMHDAMEKMTGTIVEYIHGMPVVKVFNRSLGAFHRYEDDLNRFVESVDKTAKANAAPMGWYYVLFGAQLLFLMPACIYKMVHTQKYEETLLVVILFLLIGQGLKEPLESMMNMVIMTNRITESIKRVDAILYQTEISDDGCKIPKHHDVQFEHVTFSYTGQEDVIKDVSFHVEQGSVNGIVGPSGSGKSTLLELLLRFYEISSGAIRIGGIDIREIPMKQLMNMISYVFQDSMLFRDTVEHNIRMGNLDVPFEKVEEAAKNAGIHEVIMRLPNQYQTIIGEKNAYLSGGEKQRLAIARLFLKDAPIVVMDEATAYADAENETKIQKAFAKLAANKTVFIIAHRLKTVENADHIFVLNDGKINGLGTHAELLKNCTLYKDMVDANERREKWTIERKKEI